MQNKRSGGHLLLPDSSAYSIGDHCSCRDRGWGLCPAFGGCQQLVNGARLPRNGVKNELMRYRDPERIHDQLTEVIPKPRWTRFCHLIQAHGRRTCKARTPACPVCPVRTVCPWPDKTRS